MQWNITLIKKKCVGRRVPFYFYISRIPLYHSQWNYKMLYFENLHSYFFFLSALRHLVLQMLKFKNKNKTTGWQISLGWYIKLIIYFLSHTYFSRSLHYNVLRQILQSLLFSHWCWAVLCNAASRPSLIDTCTFSSILGRVRSWARPH